jgi:uncharacterized protein YciI
LLATGWPLRQHLYGSARAWNENATFRRACHESRDAKRPRFRQAPAMFVIELVYKVPLTEIDAKMRAHVAFLKKYYASGNFVVSGRKIPRDGGIILAVGESLEQIEAIMRQDPFVEQRLAEFRVIQFRVSQRADDIEARIKI